mmetsp:Transcript_5561/g.15953  ORF Transcript_5561/g.15953 Transcript_5561/m.15953 type:complete len:112 (-) Transcript_5561:122-457(-)
MAAILKCKGKAPELVLLEIQSYVRMDDGSPVSGKEFGYLELQGDGVITLVNGPRTLYGSIKKLPKPLVLMQRTESYEPFKGDEARKSLVLKVRGVVRKKAVFTGRPQLSIK